jgi:hypothetical protein
MKARDRKWGFRVGSKLIETRNQTSGSVPEWEGLYVNVGANEIGYAQSLLAVKPVHHFQNYHP